MVALGLVCGVGMLRRSVEAGRDIFSAPAAKA
jgi:hypothetical protein